MKNVHVGWGPVGMTPIKTHDGRYIRLNKNKITGISGETFILEVRTNIEGVPVWQSSNEDVATIDQSGVVFLKKEGTAIIEVLIGNLKATCRIDVVLSQEEQFIKDLEKGIANLNTDITKSLLLEKNVEINLNGHTLTAELVPIDNGETDSIAIQVEPNTRVEINDGNVAAQEATYSIAVWARGGEVVINGGTFTNAGEGSDLIYASNGGCITIYGGEFKACKMQPGTDGTKNNFTALNLKDNTGSSIVVYGGTFYGFDPAHNVSESSDPNNPANNFVAEGYKSVKIGEGEGIYEGYGVYQVVPIDNNLDKNKIYYGTVEPTQGFYSGFHDFSITDFSRAVDASTLQPLDIKNYSNLQIPVSLYKAVMVLIPESSNLKAFKSQLSQDYPFNESNMDAGTHHANGELTIGGFKVFGELISATGVEGDYIINIHE